MNLQQIRLFLGSKDRTATQNAFATLRPAFSVLKKSNGTKRKLHVTNHAFRRIIRKAKTNNSAPFVEEILRLVVDILNATGLKDPERKALLRHGNLQSLHEVLRYLLTSDTKTIADICPVYQKGWTIERYYNTCDIKLKNNRDYASREKLRSILENAYQPGILGENIPEEVQERHRVAYLIFSLRMTLKNVGDK